MPYEVAATGDVRDAFRRYRSLHEGAWSWAAACVPSGMSEAEEAASEEAAHLAAKEKKRRAEKARKERRRQQQEERAAAAVECGEAMERGSAEELAKRLVKARELGCDETTLRAAEVRA